MGSLLVAVPGMLDLNFEGTVVFLFEHDAEGSAGVILNRPSDLAVAEALPDLTATVAEPRVVFLGGPVRVDHATVLAATVAGTAIVDPAVLDPGDTIRVFAGYAGWSAGQLEEEVEQGGWFVLAADQSDVITDAPEHLWRDVFDRQEGRLRRYRTFPDDPRLN